MAWYRASAEVTIESSFVGPISCLMILLCAELCRAGFAADPTQIQDEAKDDGSYRAADEF
jgi:hypothetical protein